ncbi:hypothetical protein [Chitinophaga vietnamensis]|uniref:hypothetical protein n=1 Tax=Chitinophaga vietnamensis TaxID=2593957 RepID=UPI0011777E0B|nr:hypothetical protein [Chitinophaga vietnamensis]
MKYLLIICIFVGLLLENFSKGLIVMQYWANETFIAQNLCENRDKPQLHCNGKCHLKKQLDRDSRQDKESNNGKERFEVMYVDVLQQFHLQPATSEISKTSSYRDPAISAPVFAIFHPPQWQLS